MKLHPEQYTFLFTILLGALISCSKTDVVDAPILLRCEYLEDPLGIDSRSPRLQWKVKSLTQSAYRIIIGTDSMEVAQGKGNTWDSKKIGSDNTMTFYPADSLKPFTKYYWSVQTWAKENESPFAPVASFETGFMGKAEWQGKWISDTADVNLKPAPYFRVEFRPAKKIKSARAYIVAAGLYELSLNGKRVGDHILDPMYTRFDRRNLYVTYDVTSFISNGENVAGVLLGNGWYNHQSTAVWDFHKAGWRARPRFLMNLRITYDDNTIETIVTGKNWKTSLSPTVFNSIYTAEHYDSRNEQNGWDTPAFDDKTWKEAIEVPAPSNAVHAQVLHPIRVIAEIVPTGFKKINDNKYIYDLGKNIAGISRITLNGEAGTELRLKHGEVLDSIGNVDQSNIDVHYRPTDDSDPFQTDIFVLSGKGTETFSPKFNYKGFQYVEVTSNKPVALTKESLNGIELHSDVPVSGSIHCSNPLINKIWEATNNSYLSNLYGYPTDCPQREKNGWTGDAHIAIETGLYNFDGITIYEKWLADHRDEQQANGILPSIIPTAGWGYTWGNGPDWTSTIAIIPWNIYLFYGDKKLLEDCYDNIKRYVDHITEISPAGLTDWGLGDWVPVKSVSPKELTSSLYYYADAMILSHAARVLDKETDANAYAALSKKIADAINAKYLNTETGLYGSGLQTELSAPLFWGIVPENVKPRVIANLVKRIHDDNDHIDVGLLGTKTILNALSDNGHADLAYTLASQETFPSWGYWIKNGATTLFENWPIDARQDISRNHIMFGEIGAWLYKGPGGIKPDPEHPGFKHVVLQPHFVKGLDNFTASHTSPYGEIVSSWKRDSGKIMYSATVPPNSKATLKVAATAMREQTKTQTSVSIEGPYATAELNAGTYTFEIEP